MAPILDSLAARPQAETMICRACRSGKHEKCRGGSWCECQHRVPKPAPPATGRAGE